MVQQITEKDGVHQQWYEDAKKQTAKSLPAFIRHLTKDYDHDYGTICRAIAAAAVGAAWAVNNSPQGGITGFQSWAVMWEFITHWTYHPGDRLRMIEYKYMLYPQYADDFTTIKAETWQWLQEQAAAHLAEGREHVASEVVAHWQSIVAGVVPFGFIVKDD